LPSASDVAVSESRYCQEKCRCLLGWSHCLLEVERSYRSSVPLQICDHMDGFSSAEEAWLSSITETLCTWRYVMQETYESAGDNKDD